MEKNASTMRRLLTLGFLLLSFGLAAAAEEMKLGRYIFENPLGKGKVVELSENARSVTWPASVPYKQATTEMVVVSEGPEAVALMKKSGGDIYKASLGAYLGVTDSPETINKTLFFGSTSQRCVYESDVPREHQVHVFSKTLPDGSFVLVGIRQFKPHDEGTGDLIQSIANTFRTWE